MFRELTVDVRIILLCPSIETIYRETVRPLPVDEQIRLADMIREKVDSERRSSKARRSALDILESLMAETPPRTAAEIDEYLRSERDSWDD